MCINLLISAKLMVSDYLQKWRMILTYLFTLVKNSFFLGWEWKRMAAKGTRIIIDFTKNSAVVVQNYKLQVLQKILQMSVFTQE